MDKMDDRAFLGYSKQKRKTTMTSASGHWVKPKRKNVVPSTAPKVYGGVWERSNGTYWGRAKCGKFSVGFVHIQTEQEALSHLRAAEQLVQQFYDERML